MSENIKHLSCYPVICAASLPASRDFYRLLVGLESVWENDWFVMLQAPDRPDIQLGFVRPDNDSLPEGFRGISPAGVVVTVEVQDATEAQRRATAAGIRIVQPLRDEAFGQRHFMAADPDGLLVDVVETLFIPDPATV